MSTKLITGISILGLILLIGVWFMSIGNTEVRLKNKFKAEMDGRTAFYVKMKNIFSGKAEVATRNDSAFRNNINAIMQGRKDGEGLVMKWVKESNPNANFEQVSALYADLSRSIEAERTGFFNQERVLQDIKMQHDNLLEQFPGSVI